MFLSSFRDSYILQAQSRQLNLKKHQSKNLNRTQVQFLSKPFKSTKKFSQRSKFRQNRYYQASSEPIQYQITVNEPSGNNSNSSTNKFASFSNQSLMRSTKRDNTQQNPNQNFIINKINKKQSETYAFRNISSNILKIPKNLMQKKRYSLQVQQDYQSFQKTKLNQVFKTNNIDQNIRNTVYQNYKPKSAFQCKTPQLKKNRTSCSNQKMSSFYFDAFNDKNLNLTLKQKTSQNYYSALNSSRHKNQCLQRLKSKVNSYIALMNDFENKASLTLSTSASIQFKSTQCSQENSPVKSYLTPREQNQSNKLTNFLLQSTSQYQKKVNKSVSIEDFFILKKVGSGTYGQVYASIHKPTNSLYALKKISKSFIKKNNLIDRIVLQIKIQGYISHPNIVKLYGYFDDQQSVYMILEYMEEGSLYQLMKNRNYNKPNVKLFSKQKTADILGQVLKGVNQLHQNHIIHRDIKPQNIIMSYNLCKLCDLGWSVYNSQNQRRNTACGTFDYLPPQILKNEDYNQSIDLWQVGILSFELMTGNLPFYHKSLKQTINKITNFKDNLHFPKDLPQINRSFIRSLIKKKQEQRISANSILLHPYLSSCQ